MQSEYYGSTAEKEDVSMQNSLRTAEGLLEEVKSSIVHVSDVDSTLRPKDHAQKKNYFKTIDQQNRNVPHPQDTKDKEMGPRITKTFLKEHCKQNKLYMTPHLNDTLYLHYKGFSAIENLEDYTGLKCLWLECNGIQRIQNLEAQSELRCLFLHQNLIHRLENLEPLSRLSILNLCNNYIKVIENISCLAELSTLQLAQNMLQTVQDIAHLTLCPTISVLDLSHNKLNDPDILTVLGAMPELRVLNLMGNEVRKNIPNYRKTLIVHMKQLTFLDDRPVFPKERACAEAWASGGLEAERQERQMWETRERRKIQESVDAMITIRDRAREQQQLEGRQKGDTATAEESQDALGHGMDPGRQEKIQASMEDSLQAHEEILGTSAESGCTDIVLGSLGFEREESNSTNCIQANQDVELITELESQLMVSEGALVTELEKTDHLETIYLDGQPKICIDDLPDLEEVDDKQTAQDMFRPKIEVIYKTDDERDSEELTTQQIGPLIEEVLFTPEQARFPETETLDQFLTVSKKHPTMKPGSHIMAETRERLDRHEEPEPRKPRCLIEELD